MRNPSPFAASADLDAAAMLSRAILFAADAHKGQVDKLGEPYILHPLRVMQAVPPSAHIAAVLHDVIEDTTLDDQDLLQAGFSLADVDAVVALTRQPGELYSAFIIRCAQNRTARLVKVADIRDNLAPWRFDPLPLKDRNRLGPKYRAALKALGAEP